MHRILTTTLGLIAALLLGTTALAQTPATTPSAASPVASTFPGLQEGVSRQYSPDPTAIPAENPDAFALITVHLFRFDTSNHATSAWESLKDGATDQFTTAESDMQDIDIQDAELDDLGDRAYAVWLSAVAADDTTGYYRTVYVQNGEFLLFATAIAGSEAGTHLADKLAGAITQREMGSESGTLHADGTSTGGIWNKIPQTADPDAGDLVALSDKVVEIP